MRNVLALVLAGGKGTRLEPLTRDRAKPAVPFGGPYRIIDFTLSNCINSGLRRMLVLTQYKAASLDRHLNLGWRFLCRDLDEFIDVMPPQQRIDENWYLGTADAVYQNIYTIEKAQSDYILILSGDHIYKMDYSELIRDHIASGADASIGCIPVTLEEASDFGVMQIDESHRVIEFQEKPANPKPVPDDPKRALASMGIYVFKTKCLFEQLCRDATTSGSRHDFGKDILPAMLGTHKVQAFPYRDKNTGSGRYWRDVGTLDAFYAANMDLISVDPQLNLYDQSWAIRTHQPPYPPPKFIFAQDQADPPRVGCALDSMVSAGCIISGGRVERSILSPNVRVNSWAEVTDSILFDGVDIGRHARVKNAIIDKGVSVPPAMEIGYDLDTDRRRGFTVTDEGVVCIGKFDGFVDLDETMSIGGAA